MKRQPVNKSELKQADNPNPESEEPLRMTEAGEARFIRYPTLEEEILILKQKHEELETQHKLHLKEKERLSEELETTQDEVKDLKTKVDQLELENDELKEHWYQFFVQSMYDNDPNAGTLRNKIEHKERLQRKDGYISHSQEQSEHRLVWIWHHGHVPLKTTPKLVVDHRDGNRANNALHNLRAVIQIDNSSSNKYVPKSFKKQMERPVLDIAQTVAISILDKDDMSEYLSRLDLKLWVQERTGLNIDKMALCILGSIVNLQENDELPKYFTNFYQTPLRILCYYDQSEGQLWLKEEWCKDFKLTRDVKETLTFNDRIRIKERVAVWVWHHGKVLPSYTVRRKRTEKQNKIEFLYLSKVSPDDSGGNCAEELKNPDRVKLLRDLLLQLQKPSRKGLLPNVFRQSYEGALYDLLECFRDLGHYGFFPKFDTVGCLIILERLKILAPLLGISDNRNDGTTSHWEYWHVAPAGGGRCHRRPKDFENHVKTYGSRGSSEEMVLTHLVWTHDVIVINTSGGILVIARPPQYQLKYHYDFKQTICTLDNFGDSVIVGLQDHVCLISTAQGTARFFYIIQEVENFTPLLSSSFSVDDTRENRVVLLFGSITSPREGSPEVERFGVYILWKKRGGLRKDFLPCEYKLEALAASTRYIVYGVTAGDKNLIYLHSLLDGAVVFVYSIAASIKSLSLCYSDCVNIRNPRNDDRPVVLCAMKSGLIVTLQEKDNKVFVQDMFSVLSEKVFSDEERLYFVGGSFTGVPHCFLGHAQTTTLRNVQSNSQRVPLGKLQKLVNSLVHITRGGEG